MSHRTTAMLHNLLFSEEKDQNLLPLDLLLTVYLIERQTEDHTIFDSQATLAARLNCERTAIARSIKRLEKAGWVIVSRRGRQRSLALSINPVALPQAKDRTPHQQPSDFAQRLAAHYVAWLRQNGRKLPKGFQRREVYSAQNLLDRVKGDEQRLEDLYRFAYNHPDFGNLLWKRSLYHLNLQFPKLITAFENERAKAEVAA